MRTSSGFPLRLTPTLELDIDSLTPPTPRREEPTPATVHDAKPQTDAESIHELRSERQHRLSIRSLTRVLPFLAAFAIAFGGYLAAYQNIRAQSPTGDEPTYVLDAFSMARDGDRDLSNQYSFSRPDELTKLFGVPAFPHVRKLTKAGEISWHGAGVGFAMVPGVWIGDSRGDPIGWMRLEMVLIDALAALALFALVRRIGEIFRIRQAAVWVVWLVTAASLPLVVYADQMYPEVLALLCTLIPLNVALRARPGWLPLALGSLVASYLPWLHIRFIPLCFGLLGALLIRALGSHSRTVATSGWVRKTIAESRAHLRVLTSRAGLTAAAAVGVPALVSFGLMAVEFDRWYGSPAWTAVSGGGDAAPAVSVSTWYPAVLGSMFGTDYGWLPWAPVAALGLAALGCLLVMAPRWGTYALLVVGLYQAELALSGVGTPGFVFPGRYEIVCIPLLAVPTLLVLSRLPVTWLAFAPLAVATVLISYDASQNSGYLLLNTGTVKLPAAAHLSGAFPDVEIPGDATGFAVGPESLDGVLGSLAPDRKYRIAHPADGRGTLSAGPRAPLASGVYTARFTISQTGGSGMAPVAEIQIWSLPDTTLAARRLTVADLPDGRQTRLSLPFATPGGLAVESRVIVFGRATIRAGGTSAEAVSLSPSALSDRYPSGALMAAWVGGVTFIGALLVSMMRARLRLPGASDRVRTGAGRVI